MLFADRAEGGRALARRLQRYAKQPDVVVLGLPRGGVVVAAQVARALHAPLDAFLVRKLGVPGQEELALGAIAMGGVRVLNRSLVDYLGFTEAEVESIVRRERAELERRNRLYRDGRPVPELTGKVVLLVDDGLATGATMRAAIAAVRQQQPASVVVAVPVAPAETAHALAAEADDVVCTAMPEPFHGVGAWYGDFAPTSDEEVRRLLQHTAH